MTEEEWNACTHPQPMLDFLENKVSDRKLRLFAVGCCRRIWSELRDVRSRKAVEIGELFADGAADAASMEAALEDAGRVPLEIGRLVRRHRSERHWLAVGPPTICARLPAWPTQGGSVGRALVESMLEFNLDCSPFLVTTIHCISGNPFRPIRLDPTWLSPIVEQLAEGIYEERAFDRMPILGDALEEAGCSKADILNHCRQPGEHVRGCWVVDLILGKS